LPSSLPAAVPAAVLEPGEVFDLGNLECRVEPILHVFDGLPGLATRGVREHVRTIRHALGIERLQRRHHSRVQRDRVWSAALGSRNSNDAVQKVDVARRGLVRGS